MMSMRISTAVLLLILTGLSPAFAQFADLFGPGDRQALASFRPSMDIVTTCNKASKALAAAAQKDPRLKVELAKADANSDKQTAETIEQNVKEVEKDSPLVTAFMARNGCSVRDYFLMASQFMMVKMLSVPEFAKDGNFLPPETVAFWRKNEAAADRLLEEAGNVLEFKKE
jgi:hypothetical protein